MKGGYLERQVGAGSSDCEKIGCCLILIFDISLFIILSKRLC